MIEKQSVIKPMDSDLSVIIPRVIMPRIAGAEDPSSLLLHEAARRYDYEYLQALLQQDRCNVQTCDSDGRTALHILLEDGFTGHLNETEMVNCIKILIYYQIDLNFRDRRNNTALSLAVDNEFSKCTLILLNAGAHCSVELATKIAHCMPSVLLEILDNGISIDDSSSKGDIFVKLDWRPVLQFPQTSTGDLSFKKEQKETQFLYNILDTKSDVREKFLYHPLVQAFVHLKNNRVSSKFWLFFIISFLYPICYGVFIWFLYFEHCKLESKSDHNSTIATIGVSTHCELNVAITVAAALLLIVNASWTLVEVYMLLRVDIKYLTSWRSWIVRVSIIVMGVTLWPGLFYQDGYNISWQYPIASLGIFLSWVLFLIQMGFYQKFSIFLEMLVKILITVLKIILMFLPLFIGFYMGFNLLFSNMGGIFDFIMMTVDVGSVGYDEMSSDAKDQAIWFQALANTFSVGFLIIIVIVFINFLLALSIRDVEILKGRGKLASVSRMIQNLFVIDLMYPNSVLIPKEDLKQGRHFFRYNPKADKQALPSKIRMKITLLLKERNSRNARKEQLHKLLENEGSFENAKGNNDSVKHILQGIAELESKIDTLPQRNTKASD